MDVLTISSTKGILEEREPRFNKFLFPNDNQERAQKYPSPL